jgi:hypothetical protein
MPKKGQTSPSSCGCKKKPKRGVDLLVSLCVFNAIVYTICQHNSNCLPYQLGVSKMNNLEAKLFGRLKNKKVEKRSSRKELSKFSSFSIYIL